MKIIIVLAMSILLAQAVSADVGFVVDFQNGDVQTACSPSLNDQDGSEAIENTEFDLLWLLSSNAGRVLSCRLVVRRPRDH